MYISDMLYSDKWLYVSSRPIYTITSYASSENDQRVWGANRGQYIIYIDHIDAYNGSTVNPSVYLKAGINVIFGNGSRTTPYILGL